MNEYIRTTKTGTKYYFKDKEMTILHREGGPAIIRANGNVLWYQNDKLHRMGGPAIEYITGVGYKVWYVDGMFILSTDGNGNMLNKMK